MKSYDHKKIEKKWQTLWEKKRIYAALDPANTKEKKYYSLIEFPYPSGDGLHVGHPRPYIGMDVISRKRRMEGYNVLYPIGWDAFGLPTENYAIKTGKDPAVVTKANTDNFRRQIKSLGISFDWSREINTTDPKYYKWTQWIFLQLFKKRLAYKARIPINWCTSCKIGLANEEVVNGVCERCGGRVERREKEQWMLAITKYAERLDKDLDTVDFLPHIKLAQKNWIGRSEGALIKFKVESEKLKEEIEVFTTRPDTLYGATYLVLAPEHELLNRLKLKISNWKDVAMYILETKMQDEMARTKEDKSKTGIELKGITATNPATDEEIPVWIADYVLPHYGTGAIMAVPAHDERDFEFAKKFNLSIKYVISEPEVEVVNPPKTRLPFVYRKAMECYVRNPKDDTFLMLEWKTASWKTAVTGGVENGEDMIEAAIREVKEETGYKNLKFIQHLGAPMRVEFYHPGKNENRRADFYGIYFELENEDKGEISKEEQEKHIIRWIPRKDVLGFITTSPVPFKKIGQDNLSYSGEGVLINSGRFDGLTSKEAKKKITDFVGGEMVTKFKLRDWVFSRQRYWGEPIPIIFCKKCGTVPVPEKDLPVKLPIIKNYQPTDSGESPLAKILKWVNVKCPNCKGPAKRETDTMPNWAGSSWYYLRYADPKNAKVFADKKKLDYFTPVDWYNGGNEHTTLHLLYSRFWHKFLYDLKLVPTHEPYKKRTSHGLILAEGGEKMSKSRGNVVNPDDIVERFGADSMRVYEMFMGPFDQAIAWSEDGVVGPRRFLERVWKVASQIVQAPPVKQNLAASPSLHKLIKKVSEDIEAMKFNTAISSLMIFLNENEEKISKEAFETYIKLLAPFAPHITDELWAELGHKSSIHTEKWPEFDPDQIKDAEVKIVIQVNGKVRGEIIVSADAAEEEVRSGALNDPNVAKYVTREPKKVIFVPGRLINIVV